MQNVKDMQKLLRQNDAPTASNGGSLNTPTYIMHIPFSILTATVVSPFIPLISQANALAT